jgi:hypothetical protein
MPELFCIIRGPFQESIEVEKIKIENWEIVCFLSNLDKPPELRRGKLYGNVYGHPYFKDGRAVTTTTIMELGDNCVKTRNHWYELGKPSDGYAAWCEKRGKDCLDILR